MQKAGKLWIPDGDTCFEKIFKQTGDKFQDNYLQAALSYVTKFNFALDIGAHVGSWTRVMANRFDKIEGFEPVPAHWDCLVKNTEGYGNVKLHNVACADKTRQVTFEGGNHNSGQQHILKQTGGNIPAITIDSLNLDGIDFIKIDTEGYEYRVLLGATETIKRCYPVIHIEENGLHSRYESGEHPATDYLLSLGYTLVLKNRWDWTFVKK